MRSDSRRFGARSGDGTGSSIAPSRIVSSRSFSVRCLGFEGFMSGAGRWYRSGFRRVGPGPEIRTWIYNF